MAVPRLVARAVDEVAAVERRSAQEAACALSSSARQHLVVVVQVVLLADLGPKTVSSVAPDEDLAGAAGASQGPGPGKAHLAAHMGSAAEAEG